MKKSLLMTLMVTMPLITLAQGKFQINGKLENSSPKVVYFSYLFEGKNIVDSTTIANGDFHFKGTLPGPTLCYVSIKAEANKPISDFKALFIDSGVFSIKGTDSVKNAKISGSALHNSYEAYTKAFEIQDKIMKSVTDEFAAATPEQKSNSVFAIFLQEKFKTAQQEKLNIQHQYIQNNPDSPFSLMALKEMAYQNIDLAIIGEMFKNLDPSVRESLEAVELSKMIVAAERTTIGALAPDFVQNDVAQNPVKLADFRGKYLLIDFWAAWCKPCREVNPSIVKLYNSYKNKNFTILGVSLDRPGEEKQWKNAIKMDKLTWTQVSDLKFWQNEVAILYGVRSIPQNFLLDPNGKIIAKNLKVEDLEKLLAELIK